MLIRIFLKKYHVNKKAIKEDPKRCLDEYDKLNVICETISENSVNSKEFLEYMQILDMDNVQEYLLKMMPNNDLNILANRTGDWNEKLYYYSFLKKAD